MTDRERQHRLRIENRLTELRTKRGRDLEDMPMQAVLDHFPETDEERRQWYIVSEVTWIRQPKADAPVRTPPSANGGAAEVSVGSVAPDRGGRPPVAHPQPEVAMVDRLEL